MPDATQPHYFATPAGPEQRRRLAVHLAGQALDVETADGVFSRDRVDAGTAVLQREVPAPPDGPVHLLDLGCGWGALALTMALLSPAATVWAVDVNERAVALTRDNARRLGLGGVRAVAPDDVPDDVAFAAIWSNPPIRVGKPALHEMLLRWLPRLAPDGAAHLVVQKNLGADSLATWLAAQVPAPGAPPLRVERAANARGYRVLRVER